MRKAKGRLRCQICGEKLGAGMKYCGYCGAAITNLTPEAAAPPLGTAWSQHAEAVAAPAAPVDWPLPQVDEANAPLSIDQGIDHEPTIPSLVGPGSLIMPAPVSQAAQQPQAPIALPATSQAAPEADPQAIPQAISQATPEFTSEFASQVAAHVAAHIASTPQISPAPAAAPLVAPQPVIASHPLASSTPLAMPVPSMRTGTRFLAATLELVTPGLGMMYLSAFWLGALILVSTLFVTFLLIGVAVANAQVVHLADVVNFLGWLLLAHLLWLLTRVLWVWKLTARQPALSVA